MAWLWPKTQHFVHHSIVKSWLWHLVSFVVSSYGLIHDNIFLVGWKNKQHGIGTQFDCVASGHGCILLNNTGKVHSVEHGLERCIMLNY